jgi:hypothetical protein
MTTTIDLKEQTVREAQSPSNPMAANTTRSLTVEHLLYAAIVAAALLWRFVGLGAEPLSPAESAVAWSAWQAANAQPLAGAPAPTSALLYGLQSLLFWIAGSSDVLARTIPALASVATVLLPLFWRGWIGRQAALVAAAIFALDPWLMAFGRRSDAAALAMFLALLALTALWQWRFQPDRRRSLRWERAAAVAIALLLTSGPLAWSFLPVLVAFMFIYGFRREQDSASLLDVWRPQRSTWLWFGVTLALAATGFALRGEALSALSASLSAWIGAVGGSAITNPLAWPFQRLLLDQPLLAMLGALGLVLLWLRPPAGHAGDRRLATFLSIWLAWGVLLWLLPGRPPEVLPVVGIPLALSAASLIGRLLDRPWGDLTGLELFTLLVVQTVLVVAASIWLAALVESSVFNGQVGWTSVVILALMIAIWIIFGVWAGWRSTGRVAIIFYAVLLGLLTVRSGWQLNHTTTLMQPDGFWPALTSNDVRLLVQDVERLSSIRRGDPNQIDLQIVYDVSPDVVLGWHLREMRHSRHVRGVDAPLTAEQALPLIIAPTARNDSLQLPDPYIGSDYDTVYAWRSSMLPQADMVATDTSVQQRWSDVQRPQLRWLLYRTTSQPPMTQTVTLWAPR